ncbi:MAG: tyrosine-protein phosphatase [Dehalococcoidia bacterium]|nr:tyrosine-protein phosphatase [Dehalococcoidia bacterium]
MRNGSFRLRRILVAAILALAFLTIGSQKYISVAYDRLSAPVESPAQTKALSATDVTQAEHTYPPDEVDATPTSSHATSIASWISSPLSEPLPNPPIAHFGVVEQGILYRSAQPSEADYRWLLSRGFKSIVDFRQEKGDRRDQVLGLGFQNYLWLNIEDETMPTDEQAERFLDFVTDSKNWPILTHCKVGLGRTGTMAALVRYAIDGWPMEKAIKEARLYRGGVDLVPSQMAWLKHWAAEHPPACHRPVTP